MSLDRQNLGFAYRPTNAYIRTTYKNGQRGALEVVKEETISLHIAATCLHYGQEIFEGMKAFCGADGQIRLFRPEENAKRMQASAERLMMQAPSTELFIQCVQEAIRQNKEFVPPYGSGASLYIRPLLIGSGPQIGVKPAEEYTFLVFVMPVGPYYKGGLTPIEAIIAYDYDRAAPLGVGSYKVGGNYAASIKAGHYAKSQGYSVELYLDAKEKKYIDECGTANFFAIKDGQYLTPKSDSILPSITNKSLRTLAEYNGLKVLERQIAVEELADVQEAGACGTAAVITPISKIHNPQTQHDYSFGAEVGPVTKMLYDQLTGIQCGDLEDEFGWNVIVDKN